MKHSAAILVVLALLFSACDSQAPLVSDDTPGVSQQTLAFDETSSITLAVPQQAEPQRFRVCKQYVGTAGPSVIIDFTVDEFNDGSIDVTDQVTLADGECAEIWTNLRPDIPDLVTVTEQVPAGYAASFENTEVILSKGVYTYTTVTGAGDTASGLVQGLEPRIGTLVVFTNTEVPETGEEGCTPGYWKNHLSAWAGTGFSPDDDFDTTFGVDLFNPDITLNEAVRAKGGQENRLARHGTAALLSAAHAGVAYPYTVAEVIALVQAGDADALEQANELGCPL